MISNPVEFLVGLLAGALSGVVLDEVLGAPLRQAIRWLPRRRRLRSALAWEGANRDSVEVLQTWSADNVLLEEHVVEHWDAFDLAQATTLPGAATARWTRTLALFEHPADFKSAVSSFLQAGTTSPAVGDRSQSQVEETALAGAPEFENSWIANLTGFVPRWRESRNPDAEKVHLLFSPARYVETMAVAVYSERHPSEWESWQDAIRRSRTELGRLPPGTFWVSVSVTSLDGRLLAWRRSGNVHTAVGKWTIGTDETMKPPSPEAGRPRSTLFELARRSLKEEVGLDPDDYADQIHFSSIGIARGSLHLPRIAIGHVWSSLRSDQIEDAWLRSESANEHTDLLWLPSDEKTLRQVAAGEAIVVGDRTAGPDWLYTNWLVATGRWAISDPRYGRR